MFFMELVWVGFKYSLTFFRLQKWTWLLFGYISWSVGLAATWWMF